MSSGEPRKHRPARIRSVDRGDHAPQRHRPSWCGGGSHLHLRLRQCWTLALRLGVPAWVAPLVAPAVDLSILGLLLGTRHLALNGATVDQLRPARRLLIFSSVVTLALNVADPLIAGELGKAAFDSVGPLLLIGWAEVGPGFLQAISATNAQGNTPDTSGVGQPRKPIPANDEHGPRCARPNPARNPRTEPRAWPASHARPASPTTCWSARGRKTQPTVPSTKGRSRPTHCAGGWDRRQEGTADCCSRAFRNPGAHHCRSGRDRNRIQRQRHRGHAGGLIPTRLVRGCQYLWSFQSNVACRSVVVGHQPCPLAECPGESVVVARIDHAEDLRFAVTAGGAGDGHRSERACVP